MTTDPTPDVPASTGLEGLDDTDQVTVVVCRNSLTSLASDAVHHVRPDVELVPAAVGHLARRQHAHWAYIRI